MSTKPVEAEKGIRCLTDDFYWGFPDGADVYPDGWSVYYEIEDGQHHPDTNALKYWPMLEESSRLKIILIQWLISKPRSRNRWELAKFVGRKIAAAHPQRFRYLFLELNAEENELRLRNFNRLLSSLSA